jgi:hypothetical protein
MNDENYGSAQNEEAADADATQIPGSGRRVRTQPIRNASAQSHSVLSSSASCEGSNLIPTTITGRRRSTLTLQALKEIDIATIAESVFSEIRSVSLASEAEISNEAELYGVCTAFQRAFPERSFALIVTLLFELPTLFLISGGSERLCNLIGRWKYTTLISLLPIISAISGNVGLQASTLTTRAISHGHVRVENYADWLRKEITAAIYLGE